MRREARTRSAGALAASLLALGLSVALGPGGCAPADPGAELAPADHRYRARLDPAAPEPAGAMLLRFEPREGWHIVPEAAAHLELAAPAGYALARPVQGGEDALEHSEEALVFALGLRREAGTAPDPGASAAVLQGSVKFGVCRDDATGCEIVRRELALPARVAEG